MVLRDAWDAKRWVGAKVRVFFMPTGWSRAPACRVGNEARRPGDQVPEPAAGGQRGVPVAQVVLGFPAMLLVTRSDSPLSTLEKVMLSVMLWGAATAGAILESKRWAVPL